MILYIYVCNRYRMIIPLHDIYYIYIYIHTGYISWVRYDKKWDSQIGQILPQAPEVPSHFCHQVPILEYIETNTPECWTYIYIYTQYSSIYIYNRLI